MSLSRILNFAYRTAYLLAMYSGIRAAWNCIRSIVLPKSQAVVIDQHTLRIPTGPELLIRVHARALHPSLPRNCRSGMVSVQLVQPGISQWQYALLRMTSHFGYGHIEIAFYEEEGHVVIYGIRNIINANAMRIGFVTVLRSLCLNDESEAIDVLTEVSYALQKNGLETTFAAPQACVDLSVDLRLLHLNRQSKILASLKKRYQRIWRQVEVRLEQSEL